MLLEVVVSLLERILARWARIVSKKSWKTQLTGKKHTPVVTFRVMAGVTPVIQVLTRDETHAQPRHKGLNTYSYVTAAAKQVEPYIGYIRPTDCCL